MRPSKITRVYSFKVDDIVFNSYEKACDHLESQVNEIAKNILRVIGVPIISKAGIRLTDYLIEHRKDIARILSYDDSLNEDDYEDCCEE